MAVLNNSLFLGHVHSEEEGRPPLSPRLHLRPWLEGPGDLRKAPHPTVLGEGSVKPGPPGAASVWTGRRLGCQAERSSSAGLSLCHDATGRDKNESTLTSNPQATKGKNQHNLAKVLKFLN